MATKQATICVCDVCGHNWLPDKPRLPLRCAKCKSRFWNGTTAFDAALVRKSEELSAALSVPPVGLPHAAPMVPTVSAPSVPKPVAPTVPQGFASYDEQEVFFRHELTGEKVEAAYQRIRDLKAGTRLWVWRKPEWKRVCDLEFGECYLLRKATGTGMVVYQRGYKDKRLTKYEIARFDLRPEAPPKAAHGAPPRRFTPS